jgi:hypothetical protein
LNEKEEPIALQIRRDFNTSITYNQSLEDLSFFVQSFLLKNTTEVTQTISYTQIYDEEKLVLVNVCEIQLEYGLLFFPMPEVVEMKSDIIVQVLDIVLPLVVVEWPAEATPSIHSLISYWKDISFKKMDLNETFNNPFLLFEMIPQCLKCASKLHGCSLLSVMSGTCRSQNYIKACLNDKLAPEEDDVAFLLSHIQNMTDFSQDLLDCYQSVSSIKAIHSIWSLNEAIGCYASSECPLVYPEEKNISTDSVLVLDQASSIYIHVLRISAPHFFLSFKYSSGTLSSQKTPVRKSNRISSEQTKIEMQEILQETAPEGIVVEIVQFSPVNGRKSTPTGEWFLEIHYHNVFMESFVAEIDFFQEIFFSSSSSSTVDTSGVAAFTFFSSFSFI